MKIQSKFTFLAVVSLFLFAMPEITRAQQAHVKLFAHRGGSYEFEENTLEAFRSSYGQGIRGFETDIRITRDGKLVIFHDSSLERMTGLEGTIEGTDSAALRKIRTKRGSPILFLDEFLAYFQDKEGVYIEFEMKTNHPLYDEVTLKKYCDELYKRAMASRPQGSDYVFTSFDKRPLRYLKSTYPGVDLLFIKSAGLSREVIQELKELGITRVGCKIEGTTRKMVEEAKKQGITVSLWPGHTINDFILGVGLGADYLCSDIPVEVNSWVRGNLPWVDLQ